MGEGKEEKIFLYSWRATLPSSIVVSNGITAIGTGLEGRSLHKRIAHRAIRFGAGLEGRHPLVGHKASVVEEAAAVAIDIFHVLTGHLEQVESSQVDSLRCSLQSRISRSAIAALHFFEDYLFRFFFWVFFFSFLFGGDTYGFIELSDSLGRGNDIENTQPLFFCLCVAIDRRGTSSFRGFRLLCTLLGSSLGRRHRFLHPFLSLK